MHLPTLLLCLAGLSTAIPSPANKDPLASWPPANGLNTIRVPRSENTFSVSATSTIHAPASLIFKIIRNTTSYPTWNTFTVRATITKSPLYASKPPNQKAFLYLGDEMTFENVLNDATPEVITPSFEKVFDISTPKEKSKYVPKELLKKDGSWYPNLEKVYRASWGDVNPATAGQLITERFTEVIEVGKAKRYVLSCPSFSYVLLLGEGGDRWFMLICGYDGQRVQDVGELWRHIRALRAGFGGAAADRQIQRLCAGHQGVCREGVQVIGQGRRAKHRWVNDEIKYEKEWT